MSFTALPENPHRALEAFAIHRYLTAKHLVDLGIAASPTVARDHILKRHLKLGRYPLVKTKDFGRWPGIGRIPHIHYMTERGAKYLREFSDDPETPIRFPKGGVQFTRDVFHRIAVIDCHIAIRKWAEANGYEITLTALYYDKQGAQRGRGQICDTRLEIGNMGFIEPDGIFCLKKDDFELPVILEVHRFPDTGRITEQLNKHGFALHLRAMKNKYSLSKDPILLSVHEHKHTMLSTQKRLTEAPGFEAFLPGFVFSTVEQVKTDITKGWSYANMKNAYIFAGE